MCDSNTDGSLVDEGDFNNSYDLYECKGNFITTAPLSYFYFFFATNYMLSKTLSARNF